MYHQEIRSIAKSLGIAPGRSTKRDLIRRIQVGEGNFPCFATAEDLACDQATCLWRDDCFITVKKDKVAPLSST